MKRFNSLGQAYRDGFSMIEVLMVVAIVAILAALAGPSFTSTTQRFRSISEVNSFSGDLQYARSEAIKQGVPVTLCASSDGSNCSSSGNWHTGWIIFSDPAANKTIASGSILRKQKSWVGTDTFVASGATSAVTFSRDGFRQVPSSSTGLITLTLQTSPPNNNATQCVTISATGRQTTLPYGTGCS